MRLGVMMFPTDTAIQPIPLAKEVEARGFDALWFPEHSHIPVSRRTPWGGREGAPPLPDMYWRSHDQFVALAAAAAAVTTNLRLGTGITLVAQRDPLWLAKEVASLDMISDGRVIFGIGYGWNHEEMEDHGIDVKRRRGLVREKILACKELWTKEVASFSGTYVNFEASWAWPKPTQKPHPPIVVGGSPTPLHFKHIVEFADGWLPNEGRYEISEKWPELQRLAEDAGRDPATLSLGIFGIKPEADHIENMAGLGATYGAIGLPSEGPDVILPLLDRYAELVARFA